MHLRFSRAIRSPVISRAAALFLMMLGSGGCLSSSHPAAQVNTPAATKASPEIAPASTRPDGMDASTIDPAELLAQQARSYSKAMAPAIARRNAASPQTSAIQPSPPQSSPAQPSAIQPSPVQPSLVQWGDTSDTHLSLLPGYLMRSDSAPPTPAPVQSSVSSANPPSAQLASMSTAGLSGSGTAASAAMSTHAAPAPDSAQAQIASIAPAPSPKDAMQEGATDASAGDAGSQSGSGQTLAALDARFAKRVREYPHDVSAHFDYQLLQFLMDQPVPDLSTISPLPDEDREMISAVMDGLSNYRNNLRADSNMLLSHKVRPLLEMADRLRSLADLTIPTMALCREVRGYGNYEPFDGDPPRFTAAAEHPVILYCEVQNFSSQLGDSKLWQTQLVQDAVLYTEGGMSVWNDKSQDVNDSARNRRQDFFIVQRMTLPQTLPVGRYLLKVTIEDKQSHHVAEATQPLLIVAE